MRIKHNRSLISAEMLKLVEQGYGSIAPSALCLEFLYLPDDPQDHETVLHPSLQERNKIMKAVMDTIAGQFTCYQYDAPKSICFESKEWELYFWCRVFSDASDFAGEYRDFSYFRLSFNSNHSLEQQKEICDQALSLLNARFGSLANLFVAVQYTAALDEQKIADDAKRLAPSLDGRRCVYHHFEGRLVYVENTLFFMKKYAKHLGYALGPADTLQIKWQIEDAA